MLSHSMIGFPLLRQGKCITFSVVYLIATEYVTEEAYSSCNNAIKH